ncbi:hypothetical protein ACIRBX_12055 [Kitasatospora sp. NPDC096147]|uniref:hypothetical protein n=1 Tax=Kitasatospora sp. NPDC096147 TaxID=3364093 RepID=UPI0037F98E13
MTNNQKHASQTTEETAVQKITTGQALITLAITNTYTDATIETTETAVVPLPLPKEGTPEREDWEYDHLFVHTGTGRSGYAIYTVEVTDSSAPELRFLKVEFSG